MKKLNPKPVLLMVAAFALACFACNKPETPEKPEPDPKDSTSVEITTDTTGMTPVALHSQLTHVQPMTGLVLWPDQARSRNAGYGRSLSLEFSYCLPCRVVTGKENGAITYDWTWFENLLDDIASRSHQAIVRFRYEYPSSSEVDGTRGATAVPAYIKALPDYNETYSKDPGGDGPTYYADWSNAELQWFTKQFYTDFAARYGNDPRIAFLEVGFGHWAEYHIYGTTLRLGQNFPSKAYQKEFLQHLAQVMPIPWLISIDAADESYTPIVGSSELMALTFGLFDDSFMHRGHELSSDDGYNEQNWIDIGQGTRWKSGVCGGEISYYSSRDQKNFLNPDGLYGHTWEEQAAKYHITFMIANDAPSGQYGTAERFLSAGLASGYRFQVLRALTDDTKTVLCVKNAGVAPLYKDAWFTIGEAYSDKSLFGLLPGETRMLIVPAPLTQGASLTIASPAILPTQTIEFEADLNP